MLKKKSLIGAQGKIAVRATHPPENLVGSAFQFNDLTGVAKRADEVVVTRIDEHRIHVQIILRSAAIVVMMRNDTCPIKAAVKTCIPLPDHFVIFYFLNDRGHNY